jgi:pyruvate/2-oxoglutarate dehydrogenase complex dihydrolipoamide dehydrogenase (E3) component
VSPSKTLLKAAKSAQTVKDGARFGIISPEPAIDFKTVMGRVDSVVQEIFSSESPETLQAEGIDVIRSEARFINPKTVLVDGREISARRYFLCTGARPLIPPIDGLADVDYLTYETIWGLEELPLRLAVVGGGPIGCEMAQAFCRLGSSVTLVEGADRIMLQDEPEAAEVVAQKLVQEGVDLKTNAPLQRVEKTANGVRLILANDVQVDVDRILVSVGRRPVVEDLGLDAADVNHGRGGIQVNKHLRTTQANIYAAGDCTGGYQFTHYAGY